MIRRMRSPIVLLMAVLGLILAPTTVAGQATPSTAEFRPACAAAAVDTSADNAASKDLPEWMTLPLSDARTGTEYRVADYLGCTLYVETMATWCLNCKMQLTNVQEAYPNLDPNRVVVIAISVETELSAEDLATYAEVSEFDFLFSVASVDMLKAIVDAFGRESIVPPSTPHVLVAPDGTVGDLRTGGTSPEEIVRLLTELSGS
ncbi:MAG: redoxin domain-containing protein [Thermomicrobiales bacterium]